MRECLIYGTPEGYRLRYLTEQLKTIDVDEMPTELSSAVQTIESYLDTLKSPEEIALNSARQYVINKATDEEKLTMIEVFSNWTVGESVAAGDERSYEGNLYRAIQAHATQADWPPDSTPALWLKIAPSGVIPDFIQPTGAQDAYAMGDEVIFEGKTYQSLIDANVWSPAVYPPGWREV